MNGTRPNLIRPQEPKLDVNTVLPVGHDLSIRKSESIADASLRRKKDWHAFVVTLYGCIAVAAASLGVAVVSHDANTQHWAQSLIAAFIGAAAGYWGRGMTRGGSGGA